MAKDTSSLCILTFMDFSSRKASGRGTITLGLERTSPVLIR